MNGINPTPFDLRPYRKLLDDPHQWEFMTITQKADLDTEGLLDEVIAFAGDRKWKDERLFDHCFVAHVLMLNRLILNDYKEDIPVPLELDRLIRVMRVLSLTLTSRLH